MWEKLFDDDTRCCCQIVRNPLGALGRQFRCSATTLTPAMNVTPIAYFVDPEQLREQCDKIQFNVPQDKEALGDLMQINHAVCFLERLGKIRHLPILSSDTNKHLRAER